MGLFESEVCLEVLRLHLWIPGSEVGLQVSGQRG